MPDGELAIVLHTHMPYVEGFGTWPFGEEWLWEAVATSYLPLLEILDQRGAERNRAELTLSLTPVLCDQLEAPGALERCASFLRTIRPGSHRLDIDGFKDINDQAAVAELERSNVDYTRAADRLEHIQERPGALVQALGAHATWTSSATHAILPLLALHDSVELQLGIGIEAYRHRFGEWGQGCGCRNAPTPGGSTRS